MQHSEFNTIEEVCYDPESPHSGGFFEGLIVLFGALPLALSFACILSAHFNAYLDRTMKDTSDEFEQEQYTEKYPLEEASQCEDEDYRVNPNSYVMDYTPNGVVMMHYDYDEEGFIYWSNRKTVPYDVLETVARKYVKSYCCKNLYVDRAAILEEKKRVHEEKKRELEEQEAMKKEDTKTNDSNNNEDGDSSDNSVFATLKTYNNNKAPQRSNNQRNRSKSDEMLHVSERSNKFVRRGTIQEFELTQKKEYSVVDTRPKLDFETFKRLFAQSQESNNADTDDTVQNKKED